MKIHKNELSTAIVYKLFLSLLLLLRFTNVIGLPFLFGTTHDTRNHMIEYRTPDDSWNITSVPRSITPHITEIKAHSIPPRKTDEQIDDEILRRFRDIKVCVNFTPNTNKTSNKE